MAERLVLEEAELGSLELAELDSQVLLDEKDPQILLKNFIVGQLVLADLPNE